MMRFVLATGNRHKLGEYRAILAPHQVEPMPAGVELPPEGTLSFEENARAKALALARALLARPALTEPEGERPADRAGEPRTGRAGGRRAGGPTVVIADDSGIEVAALGGRPGVISARYAGVDGDDAANNARLLAELAGRAGDEARAARFVCVIASVILPGRGAAGGRTRDEGHAGDATVDGPPLQADAVRGEWPGAIALAPQGEGGFGYDSLFVPAGRTATVAQMSEADKNDQSHRARAARALLARLSEAGLA
ncbi:MAG TPA: non-canonical purine NTP pyrophosphatase [Thermoleophilia bacterium]|nr:non-canonical purine NTP pyrophosphatase [Thermoleophilia bacterium]